MVDVAAVGGVLCRAVLAAHSVEHLVVIRSGNAEAFGVPLTVAVSIADFGRAMAFHAPPFVPESERSVTNAPGQPPWASMTSSISAMMRMVSFRATTIFW